MGLQGVYNDSVTGTQWACNGLTRSLQFNSNGFAAALQWISKGLLPTWAHPRNPNPSPDICNSSWEASRAAPAFSPSRERIFPPLSHPELHDLRRSSCPGGRSKIPAGSWDGGKSPWAQQGGSQGLRLSRGRGGDGNPGASVCNWNQKGRGAQAGKSARGGWEQQGSFDPSLASRIPPSLAAGIARGLQRACNWLEVGWE